MLPAMTVATRDLHDADIPCGSTMINVLNQLATSLVTAAATVLLAGALTARLPDLAASGGVGHLQSLAPSERYDVAPAVSDAVQVAFTLPLALMVVSFVVAAVVLRRRG